MTNISQRIVSAGYFSKEVPVEFVSTDLGIVLNSLDLSTSKLSNKIKGKWTQGVEFSIPKKDNFRRSILVPHPLPYILLSQLIEKNWIDLSEHFSKSQFSLTSPILSDDTLGSIKPKFEMKEKMNRRITNITANKYILQADITRYYPSIYTHSISWALQTKEISKANINSKNKHFGDEIDKLVRNLQDGQTIGIPIGPVTSLIVQEIIGTAIDEEFREEMGSNISGYRYTDDMEYYFNSLEEAERGLSNLNKVLRRYQLELNNSKTKIIKVPIELEPEWVYSLKTFKFRNSKNNTISISMQRADVIEFFSKAFRFVDNTSDKGILSYAIKVVRNSVIKKENWDLFESLLLHSALVDPNTLPTVFEIIESYKYRNYPINTVKITNFINNLIKNNIELKNDFEVGWALSISSKLEVEISEDVSSLLLESDNALLNVLTLVLNDMGLLNGKSDFKFYKSRLTEESLYNSDWLLAYESCIQGWLDKTKNEEYIQKDPFFKQLVESNVSFINPNFSIVLEVLKEKVAEKCKEQSSVEEVQGSEDIIEARVMVILADMGFSLDKKIISEIVSKINDSENGDPFESGNNESILDTGSSNLVHKKESKKSLIKFKPTDKNFEYDDWIGKFFETNINKKSSISTRVEDLEY